jgi:hypothetical protein
MHLFVKFLTWVLLMVIIVENAAFTVTKEHKP